MRIVRYSLLSAAICLLLSAAPAYVQAASDGIAGSGDILSKYEDWIERRRQAAEETEADEEMVTDEEAAEIQIELAKEGSLENLIQKFDALGIAHIESGYLNIREKPEDDAKVIGKMVGDDVCNIKKTEGDWYYIVSGPVRGYVSNEFILTGSEAADAAIAAMKNLKVTVDTDTLNVHTEPKEDAEVLDRLDQNEKYDVIETTGDWIKIELDDESSGYVTANYVNLGYMLGRAIEYEEQESLRQQIVDYAMQYIGNPYVWGGESLTNGCDCSGFTMLVYKHFGKTLTHYSVSQAGEGTRVSEEDMQPGDLIFYAGRGGTINHVTMYIGNGKCVGAQSRRAGIQVRSWTYRTPVKIINVLD